jgi:hypothetical protein
MAEMGREIWVSFASPRCVRELWSRHSRRMEPMRSAYPFCHGERGAEQTWRMPVPSSVHQRQRTHCRDRGRETLERRCRETLRGAAGRSIRQSDAQLTPPACAVPRGSLSPAAPESRPVPDRRPKPWPAAPSAHRSSGMPRTMGTPRDVVRTPRVPETTARGPGTAR